VQGVEHGLREPSQDLYVALIMTTVVPATLR
jgi:hypothetical protein